MSNLKPSSHSAYVPWFIWGVSAVFVLFQFTLQISPSVMVTQLSNAFTINASEVGLLSSSFFYSYVLMQIPAGMLVDRFGAKRSLVASLILCTLMIILFSFAQGFYSAFITRILMGLVCAPAVSASLNLAGQWFYSQWFSFIVGLTEALGLAGGIFAQTLLSLSVTYFAWQKTFAILAVINVILLLLTLLVVRENQKRGGHQAINFFSNSKHFSDSLNVLRQPRLWINGLISGFLFALLTAFSGLWAVPYLQSLYGFSLAEAAGLSSLTFVGAALGAPLAGMLASRYAAYKCFLLFIAALSCLLLSLFIACTIKPPSLLMAIFLFLLGLFSGTYVVPFSIIRELIPANKLGFAMGFANMMCILMGAILQPLIGVLLQWQVGDSIGREISQLDVSYFRKAFLVFPLGLSIALVLSFFAEKKLYAVKFYKDIFPK